MALHERLEEEEEEGAYYEGGVTSLTFCFTNLGPSRLHVTTLTSPPPAQLQSSNRFECVGVSSATHSLTRGLPVRKPHQLPQNMYFLTQYLLPNKYIHRLCVRFCHQPHTFRLFYTADQSSTLVPLAHRSTKTLNPKVQPWCLMHIALLLINVRLLGHPVLNIPLTCDGKKVRRN